MKILQIHFQNLNSLAGEWRIDFTHVEYAANGIFAITGPTGSGKTTLLDAFCLALYGRTPRLERITESSNEIMSRHTGVCFSEVLFETKKGRYRCHWSQRRARGQATGKLQSVRHEIVDDCSGSVLESKLKDVARAVEEVTGMNFDQFIRSVLLAQGGFAAFLQASSDERAPILEQITGSEIYSRISQKVHQRRGEEQQRFALLAAEQASVTLLTTGEVEAITADLTGKKAAGEEGFARLRHAQAGLAWLSGLRALEGEIAGLKEQAEGVARQLEEAAPERLLLERAGKVRLLEGKYSVLAGLRGQQKNEETESEKVRRDLAALLLEQEGLLAGRKQAQKLFDSAEELYRQETCLNAIVRALDILIRDSMAQVEHFRQERGAAEAERAVHAELGQGILDSLAEGAGRLKKIRDYLLQHTEDADLLEDLAGLQELTVVLIRQSEKVCLLKGEMQKAQAVALNAAIKTRQSIELHDRNCQDHAVVASGFQRMSQAVSEQLAGRDPAMLREELERLSENRFALDKALQINRRIASLQDELAAGADLQRQAAASVEDGAKRRNALTETIARQRLLVEKQEQIVRLAGRIRSLDEERDRLVHGQPCPLCGAVEHPYTANAFVVPEEAEATLGLEREALQTMLAEDSRLEAGIAAASERYRLAGLEQEKLQVQLKQAEETLFGLKRVMAIPPGDVEAEIARIDARRVQAKAFLMDLDGKILQRDAAGREAEARKDLRNNSQQAMQQAVHAEAVAVENCRRMEEEERSCDEELRKNLNDVLQRTIRYGISEMTVDTCRDVLAGLTERQGEWRQQKEQEQQILLTLQRLQIDREREEALVKKQDAELSRIGQEIKRREDHLSALQRERRERYGEKDPEQEEKRMAAICSGAGQALTRLGESLHLLEKNRAVLEERLTSLRQHMTERVSLLMVEERDFREAFLADGFADEADFHAARLPDETIAERTCALDKLTEMQVRCKALLQNERGKLEAERKKELTPLSLEDLAVQTDAMTTSLHDLQQEIGMLQGRLQYNEMTRKKRQSRMEALEKQRQEYLRWQRLHDLIGSSDGKKFRNFAQGITFELMVGHANRSLQKMSDRYILTRDLLQPLELNVIDNYQAGEIRSTKNLSGGESFIVSLALALGLAGMASNTVQVDSLFLDEGFGTLDEDSLETALETLAGLQQDGKVIGIISHVPVLQERIATRIQVIPGPAGQSRLLGPGVTG